MYHSLILLAGMLCLYRGTQLPTLSLLVCLLVLAVLACRSKWAGARLIAVFLVGYCWSGIQANFKADQDIPQTLIKQPVSIHGCLLSVKSHSAEYQRLIIEVEKTVFRQESIDFSGKLSLGYYQPLQANLRPGWCGQFRAVLKPVHGSMNQLGFDYEAWAYVQHIKSLGVLKRIDKLYPGPGLLHRYLRFRDKLVDEVGIALAASPVRSLVVSLALGERKSITDAQWEVLRHSGTSHLLAISGLHIGLVFWFASLFAALLWRISPAACLKYPAQKSGLIIGLMFSALYLVLTGLPLSARRAWLMLAVAVSCMLADEKADFVRSFNLSLIVILIIWPESVLSISFWYSFGAVGLILLYFAPLNFNPKLALTGGRSLKQHGIIQLLQLQIILSMAMLPLSILFFNEASLVSPLSNMIAIPLVTFFILPVILVGMMAMMLGAETLAGHLLESASWCLEHLYSVLEYLVAMPWSWSMPVIYQPGNMVWIFAGMVLWRYYQDWPGRWLLGSLLIPLFVNPEPALQDEDYRVTVFDVGQGLAIWIQSNDKNLLVDTGYGNARGFSYFQRVIYPALTASGVKQLDIAVISHGDADHSGGLPALMNSDLKPKLLYVSEQTLHYPAVLCQAGSGWRWNNINFEFFTQFETTGDNNRSCVLKVSSQAGSILLAADIEREAEQTLLLKHARQISADVLMAPHHGSQTSSTLPFIKAVNPRLALFSSGYLNRYGHPAKVVIERYQHRKIELFNTACHGQIRVDILMTGIKVTPMRLDQQPFWRHQCASISD